MDKAAATISTVESGMRAGQCACIPGMLRTINTLSRHLQDVAVQELGDIIRNDTVVLEKVIRAANTIGYNPSGIEVNSITEAIQIIGFDRVRSLTMSLILLEGTQGSQTSEERRVAMLASLAAGILAEKLAEGGSEVDPEVAFLGGALRGFGRILLATYLLEDYRRAEALASELTPDRAYGEIFGLTPLQLGYHLMEASHLSPILLQAFRDYHPVKHRRELLDPGQSLLALTDFAYLLIHASLDARVDAPAFRQLLGRLPLSYKDVVDRTPAQLEQALKRTHVHLKGLMASFNQSSFPSSALLCFQKRIEGMEKAGPLPKPSAEAPQGVKPDPGPDQAGSPAVPDAAATRIFEESLQRVQAIVNEEARLRVAALDDILHSVKKGLEADESWIFLKAPTHPKFVFKGGSGTYTLILRSKGVIDPQEKSIFGLCLARQENMFISDIRQPRLRPHIPQWYRDNIQLNSFVLLCLKDRERVLGLLFAGWRTAREVRVHPDHTRLIHRLLGLLTSLESGSVA